MSSKLKIKTVTIEIICILYILLFVYAALSKLLDFENFQIQIGQSPLLNPFAGEISWTIPIVEIILAILLGIPQFRKAGLFSSLALMVFFTFYIYAVLNFSSFVPCSCGGILEKLGWKEHLIFNCFFIGLAIVAIWLLDEKEQRAKWRLFYIGMAILIICSTGAVAIKLLLNISERKQYNRNNFVRMFPPIAVKKEIIFDLKYNSYYFAGTGQQRVYLGNTTAPSLVLELDSILQKSTRHFISFSGKKQKIDAVHLRVADTSFYLIDGSAPFIFRGSTKKWKAYLKMKGTPKFSIAEVIDSTTIVFRSLSDKSNENILGTVKFAAKSTTETKYHSHLLQKQIDGVFDTDGSMQYSSTLKKFVYLYYYRNEFIVTDDRLNLIYRGNTIDTTSKAKLKIAWLKERNERKLAAPAFMVNRTSSVYRNLLFVNSSLPGKYEPLVMWKDASIIDVYDIESKLYLMSFYIYKEKGKELSTFMVTGKRLYALIGNSIVSYRLGSTLQKYLEKT